MSLRTPFTKVLVANRGEIALRVMRSARAAGYRTVAVYSEADAGARHAREADEAVPIGGALPAQSYLNIEALIAAARRSGADAVHPGYGFLAENAGFAQACRDAGLVFIGPSPQAIRAMGDKAGAKALMAAAGVPCVPGWQGDDQTEARLAEEAARLGWPLMIKAVAGGGGRGMRRVDAAADFPAALRGAKSEAANAFGDDRVLLERAIDGPRHVEIQVFADRHGAAVHLGERDCSVQRRHQKLVEEAPCPVMTPELRERMGAAAVAAAKAIGYEGAGTLEFLLDREGRWYFMEMNTRLQVEHPVTEAITGLDLVAWQLAVAAGEPLPLRQDEIRFDGHAIELRLCAEDAPAGFLPQSGTLSRWQPPAGLRVEHALEDGAAVPPFYDSMIAKLVAHGRHREEARRRLGAALQDLVALGVTTNQLFLARCLAHPVFAAGEADTGFIGRHLDELLAADDGARRRAAAVAAVLLVETAPGALPPAARTRARRLPSTLRFELGGGLLVAALEEVAPAQYRITVDGRRHEVGVLALQAGEARLAVDGLVARHAHVRVGTRLHFTAGGVPWQANDRTLAASARAAAAGGDGRLRASMNGRVVALWVQPGQAVAAGAPVLTLEAMKMEHVHAAPVAGTVAALHVAVGEQVAAARLLAEITPQAATGGPGPTARPAAGADAAARTG